jgi:SAM-dependent methyltransferase
MPAPGTREMDKIVEGGDCLVCQAGSSIGLLHQFEDDPHYVVVCSACSVQTIRPLPTTDELKDYYSNYPTTQTDKEQLQFLIDRHVELFEYLATWVRPQPIAGQPIRYLEVGFGNGASILAAAQIGMECSGFDLGPSNVSEVQARAKDRGLKLDVWTGDGSVGQELGKTFDFIKASQVIEHLIDPVTFVRSMQKLLAPGGFLYLECPNNAAAFYTIKNKLRRRFNRMDFYNSMRLTEHLWGFNQKSMQRLLQANDLDVVLCKDYSLRHRFFQPEHLHWYPSLGSGLSQALSRKNPYPFLKSMIAIFDQLASRVASSGLGLTVLSRKRLTVPDAGSASESGVSKAVRF